jgi:hypothetical protein
MTLFISTDYRRLSQERQLLRQTAGPGSARVKTLSHGAFALKHWHRAITALLGVRGNLHVEYVRSYSMLAMLQ